MIDTDAGDQLVAGELIAGQDLSDLWFGLSWATKVSSNIAVGVTPYFSIRDQKTRKHAYSEGLDPLGNVSASIITQQFEYKNYRLLAKAGIGANFDPLTLGLTVTSPSFSISGTGSSLINIVSSGEGTDEETVFIANFQQEVDAEHRMPLSIGFGAGYRFGKNRVHFSAEWFDAIARYTVIDSKKFTGQSTGTIYDYQVTNELQSILNYGIGAEFYIIENLDLFLSYITDYSAFVPNSKTNLTVSTWDIYHISTGASFSIGRSEFTLGVNYAFGSGNAKGPVNLPEGEVKNKLADLFANSDLDYKRLKFLIGFSIEI